MNIHFIGIGGIGVSALAQYYLAKGHQITGSDLVESEITQRLREKGVRIIIGKHKISNVKAWISNPVPVKTMVNLRRERVKLPDLVIYSPAIQENNIELKRARRLGIKCQSYPEALGELTKKYFTIAVCGTHGKSTTTAMLSLILIKAGLDPTVIIGTKLKEFGHNNFRLGGPGNVSDRGQRLLVIEADEWKASFLNYWPKIIVLTNIEKEHLDYYKNLSHIRKTYEQFIRHLPKQGVLVANRDNQIVYRITSKFQCSGFRPQIVYYSLKQPEAKKLAKLLKIPGEHNVSNALAAFSAIRYGIRYTRIPKKIIEQALSEYRGAWRRFEIKQLKLKGQRMKIVSDYAHHPTEIEATIKAARAKWPQKQIWLIFQPHQYQRTFYLFNDFVKLFHSLAVDKAIITDIYDVAGREQKQIKIEISSKKLVEAINKPEKVIYLKKEKILPYLRKNINRTVSKKKLDDAVIIIMGAGDIYKLAESFPLDLFEDKIL